MKKYIYGILSLCFCICFLLLGEPLTAQAGVRLPIAEDVHYFGFDDLAEFNAYLQTAETTGELPPYFVYPQELAPIGAFNTWGSKMYSQKNPDNSVCYYSIDLWEEDVTVWLLVEHNTYHDFSLCSTLDKSYAGADMLTLENVPDATERYVIRRGALYYYYVNNKLFSIFWYRIYEQDDGYGGKLTVIDTLQLDPYSQFFSSGFTYSPGSFMEKLLSLDEEKFREAEDVLISLGTGKYSDFEYVPPTEPTDPSTEPTQPTVPTEPTAPATAPQTQPTVPTAPTTPTEPERTSIAPLVITATLSLATGSVVTILVLRKKKSK